MSLDIICRFVQVFETLQRAVKSVVIDRCCEVEDFGDEIRGSGFCTGARSIH
jgi:hypothetical protein